MMLRWLVSNWVQQNARQQLQAVVSETLRARQEPTDDEQTPPPPADVVFIFALSVEAAGLVDLLQDTVTTRCQSHVEHLGRWQDRVVLIVEAGVGQQAAATATRDVIKLHQPPWIVSAGFAGALNSQLRRGHILLADEVVDVAGHRLEIGLTVDSAAVETSPWLHVGRLLTVDQLIRTKAEKEELGKTHGALVCDMETYAVAEVCQQQHVRMMSVRIISDGLDDELPKEIEGLLQQASLAGKLGAAAGAIFHRPSSVKDMWQLKEDALKATDRLARFLTGVIDQLPGR